MEMPFAWWSLGAKQNVLRELREPFFWCFFGAKTPSKRFAIFEVGAPERRGKLLKIFEWCPHTRPNLSQRKSHTHLKSMDQSDVCEMILKPTTPEPKSWMQAMLIVEIAPNLWGLQWILFGHHRWHHGGGAVVSTTRSFSCLPETQMRLNLFECTQFYLLSSIRSDS